MECSKARIGHGATAMWVCSAGDPRSKNRLSLTIKSLPILTVMAITLDAPPFLLSSDVRLQ